MRADKRCETCEWWDFDGPLFGGRQRQCLRWPGDPWLWTEEDRRCWQYVKRTKETEESTLEVLPEDQEQMLTNVNPGVMVRARIRREGEDLRDATRLVVEAGLATGQADTCVDLVSEVLRQLEGLRDKNFRLAERIGELQKRVVDDTELRNLREVVPQLKLRLALAQSLFDRMLSRPNRLVPKGWDEEARLWLKAGE